MMDIPPELVVEILQRLPWTSLRRLRLVCRSWRDLIHQHTTEMQQRRDALPLVVTTESADVLDFDGPELEERPSRICIPRELHLGGRGEHTEVVGVRNGVLCLCDDTKPGGAITLANPATGDVLALPPIPRHGLFRRHNTRRSRRSWHQAYSFGYHHATGQYKVVHVPCFFKTKDTLQVFTLGDAAWREVPAPAYARCRLDAGVVSVNGATYWVVTEEWEDRVMSFDLETEQVTCTQPLPMPARPIRHLTQVNRMLCTATIDSSRYYGSRITEVWVLDGRRNEQTWIHLYRLDSCPWTGSEQQITRPYFIHGDYVLMDGGNKLIIYKHKPVNYYERKSEYSPVHYNTCYRNAVVPDIRGDNCRTFAYMKTDEALSVYRRW